MRRGASYRRPLSGVDRPPFRNPSTILPLNFLAVGYHPHDASQCSANELDFLTDLAQKPRIKAWGEIGLDYNRMYSPREDQEKWFVRQLQIAAQLQLPLIFHERDTRGRFLEILKADFKNESGGVVHCFSGTVSELQEYLDLGVYIGVTGIVTLRARGSDLREMVPHIPANRLVVETDAPYLTPAPEKYHTRRNEPAFVKFVLLKLAEIRIEADMDNREVWEECNAMTFNPWQSLAAHRPVGGINRTRKPIYAEVGEFRRRENRLRNSQ